MYFVDDIDFIAVPSKFIFGIHQDQSLPGRHLRAALKQIPGDADELFIDVSTDETLADNVFT